MGEIEKDFVIRENLREDLGDRALEIHKEVEGLLAGAFKLLDLEFFLLGVPSTCVEELSESADPERVVFLLDQQFWTFPLEQTPSQRTWYLQGPCRACTKRSSMKKSLRRATTE